MQPEKTSQVILSKAIIDPKDEKKKKTKKKKPTTTTEPMDTEEVPEEVKLESIDIYTYLSIGQKQKKIPQNTLRPNQMLYRKK